MSYLLFFDHYEETKMNYCTVCHTDLDESDCSCRYIYDEFKDNPEDEDCCHFGTRCCMRFMPHTGDECHTAEMIEAHYAELEVSSDLPRST